MAGNTSGSGCNVSVTVNNASSDTRRVGRQQVTITPLPPGFRPPLSTQNPPPRAQSAVPTPVPAQLSSTQRVLATILDGRGQVSGKLDKVFLKASYKGKKDIKKFTLRHVDPFDITSSRRPQAINQEKFA